MGFTYDSIIKKGCFSDENIRHLKELGELPFKNFVKNNLADIADPDWIEAQLNDFSSRLTVPDKFTNRDIVEFLCKYESFILLVINGVLKHQNIKLYRYIISFVQSYQQYLEVDVVQAQRTKYDSIEVYSKLSINSQLINNFIKAYEKEKYYFFPGVDHLHEDYECDSRPEKG